jgi:CRP/FNR family transcriptional regulator, dissimilatory nitrate respiration regulator
MGLDWSNIPCFVGVTPNVLERLSATAHTHTYQAGATIFAEGDTCAGFHVVKQGLVRIYRISPEGRMHTLHLLRPVTSFNEVAAVDGQSNPYTATAITQSVIVRISHASLMDLLSQNRDLLQNYVQALAHMNREYLERLEDMTFRSIPSRLAKLFLYEHTYSDSIAEQPSTLTQEDIASVLGTTREVVGRAMRGLLNTGLLQKRGREVYIANREGLEFLAETNDMPEPLHLTPIPAMPRPPRSPRKPRK